MLHKQSLDLTEETVFVMGCNNINVLCNFSETVYVNIYQPATIFAISLWGFTVHWTIISSKNYQYLNVVSKYMWSW